MNAEPMALSSDPAAVDRREHPIMFVALSLDMGGAERHLSAVLPALAARGWPVALYCTNRLGAFASAVAGAGVEVIGPPTERRPGPQPLASRLVGTARAGTRLFSVMRRRRPRIAHFFLPEPYIVGAPASLMLRVPIRIMSRRGRNFYQRHWPGVASVERRLHSHMTALVANSRRVVDDLVDEGCDPARVALIYNGVGLAGIGAPVDREALRNTLGVPAGAFVMIVVASLIGYKGHADLLTALARLGADMPSPWALLCVGRDEGEGPGLARMAEQLGLAANVRFLGPRHDVAALLGVSDLAILPSHEEGFSNAVIEGMAAGLASVVTDVGGNAEAVVDGESGLVVPPHDPVALATAVLRLARDGALRDRFGAAGRARAEARFTLAACVDAYDTLYSSLVAGGPVVPPSVGSAGDGAQSHSGRSRGKP